MLEVKAYAFMLRGYTGNKFIRVVHSVYTSMFGLIILFHYLTRCVLVNGLADILGVGLAKLLVKGGANILKGRQGICLLVAGLSLGPGRQLHSNSRTCRPRPTSCQKGAGYQQGLCEHGREWKAMGDNGGFPIVTNTLQAPILGNRNGCCENAM